MSDLVLERIVGQIKHRSLDLPSFINKQMQVAQDLELIKDLCSYLQLYLHVGDAEFHISFNPLDINTVDFEARDHPDWIYSSNKTRCIIAYLEGVLCGRKGISNPVLKKGDPPS